MNQTNRYKSERGAVLIFVAVIMVALLAFLAYSVDNGVLLAGRSEAQNSADAAALAAGIQLSFDRVGTLTEQQARATTAALNTAARNHVFGESPDIEGTDVTYDPCPPGAPGVIDTCVKVNVFRTNYQRTSNAANPLPTFFARLVGVDEQGTRATATAQMYAGTGTADCVKPWGLPDKWIETYDPPDEFNRYEENGPNRGQVLSPNPDVYDPAQGYDVDADYGTMVRLYVGGGGNENIAPGFFQPVVLAPGSVGGNRYEEAIMGCADTAVGPGTVLQPEPGAMVGPTGHGFDELIALDPYSHWDTTLQKPVGGCMDSGTCSRSPRWIAVPVFDVDAYLQARLAQGAPGGGRTLPINVVKVIGLWIDEVRNNNDIRAYITHYPTTSITGPITDPTEAEGAYARTVILVR